MKMGLELGLELGEGGGFRTFVFCIIRCRGERTRATKEVEKSISIFAMLPSSLLNILEKGSVWYIRNPFEVP